MYKNCGEKKTPGLNVAVQVVCKGTQKTTRCLKSTSFSIWPCPCQLFFFLLFFIFYILICLDAATSLEFLTHLPFSPASLLPSLISAHYNFDYLMSVVYRFKKKNLKKTLLKQKTITLHTFCISINLLCEATFQC